MRQHITAISFDDTTLPAPAHGSEDMVKYIDAYITYAYILDHTVYFSHDTKLLVIGFECCLNDNADSSYPFLNNNGEDIYTFEFEINTHPNSLYSQLITSVFHDNKLSYTDFDIGIDDIVCKHIRLVIWNGRYLNEIQPLPNVTNEMRDHLEKIKSQLHPELCK